MFMPELELYFEGRLIYFKLRGFVLNEYHDTHLYITQPPLHPFFLPPAPSPSSAKNQTF